MSPLLGTASASSSLFGVGNFSRSFFDDDMIIDWYNLTKPTRLEHDSSRDDTINMGYEIYLFLCWSIRCYNNNYSTNCNQVTINDIILTAKE
jgi:hypothetical protein